MTTPARLTTAYHEPGRKKPCVCGSGLKFKRCCAGSYSFKASELFRKAANSGDFKEALIQARNHFTWYALSHKAHTIHLLEADPGKGEKILRTDIEALSDLLDRLHWCYYRLGRSKEFPNVIESVRNAIDDRRWDSKIAYTLGLWFLVDMHDEKAAYTALQPINLQTCQDSDVLSLYIQVCPTRLTLTESVDIIDRIIDNTREESVRLQYRVLKAVKYYLVCQQADSDKMFEDAISSFADLPEEKKSSYGKLKFAYALEVYGKAANRQDILEQARDAVKGLIHEAREECYTASYFADLYRLLGDCEEGLGNHHDAVEAYSICYEKNSSELTKVFLSRSVCNDGKHNKSRELLESIDDSYLDEAGKFDLAISWAILAAISLLTGDLEKAKSRLKEIETHDPIFIQLRDRYMIDLLESKPKSKPGNIQRLLRSLNKYVILNPNFLGIGINLNRIIDDAESETHTKRGKSGT